MYTRHLSAKLPGADPLIKPSSSDVLGNSVMLRKSGLLFARGLRFNKWEAIGQQLLSVNESTTWWIADWIAYGEQRFQDRYRDAVQRTSLNYQTLRNYAWVARRFDLSRRRDNLSFGHHAEVAALERAEQDYWLRKAEELTWSRNQLRNEVRNSLRLRQANGESRMVCRTADNEECAEDPLDTEEAMVGNAERILSLSLTTDQFAQFTMVAHSQNQELEEWALHALENLCDTSDEISQQLTARSHARLTCSPRPGGGRGRRIGRLAP